jgi:NADPH:quinone reductase-like Zn-dependent oxidoreductase
MPGCPGRGFGWSPAQICEPAQELVILGCMKAAVRSIYGPSCVLSIQEVEMPTPGDGEVLIRVYATTVNRTDCHILRGKPLIMRFITGLFKPRLFTRDSDRYDLVFDAVGKNSFGKCKSLLKKKGIYSSSRGPNFLRVFITSLPGRKRKYLALPKT